MITQQDLKKQISQYFIAKKQGATQHTLIKKAERIKSDASAYNGCDKWICAFRDGETVTNKYNAKLFFKLAF